MLNGDPMKPSIPGTLAKTTATVRMMSNPNHDEKGRFSSGDGGGVSEHVGNKSSYRVAAGKAARASEDAAANPTSDTHDAAFKAHSEAASKAMEPKNIERHMAKAQEHIKEAYKLRMRGK